MPIRVTCPGCHTRFNVSDKFAGREGPCPKCKKVITVPSKSDEVVVHAPESGPKDAKGRSILKPIARKETKISSVQIAIIACTIDGFLVTSLLIGQFFSAPDIPFWLFPLGALALAVPVCIAGYSFLRDQELDMFVGQELWIRLLGCAAVYALLWFLVPLMNYAFVDLGQTGAFVAIGIMLAGGAGVASLAFDLDYFIGLLHAGLYLGCCLLCRLLTGAGAIPQSGSAAPSRGTRDKPPAEQTTDLLDTFDGAIQSWVAVIFWQ